MQLEKHRWRLNHRIDALGEVLKEYRLGDTVGIDQFKVERVLIQLQIEWEHFVRAVVLDSATGQFRSRSGPVVSRLPVRVKNREHASLILLSKYKKRSIEPDWYLPSEAISAADKLSLSNYSQIARQLGVSPWELEDLRHLRNFIAHRSNRAAKSVRSTGYIPKSERIIPCKICFDYTLGGMQRYERWIEFMKIVANGMVQ